MKLWHDDIRPAPEGWEWARTNDDAIAYLEKFDVTEISMDHDLGLDYLESGPDTINLMGEGDATGFHLAQWMCYNEKLPAKITVHSWNVVGAQRMIAFFKDYGVEATYEPY